eukprot:CAMPEP_0175189752 /NCGR_PEP_ID=MMETSP0093-20121207/4088_1 /TAXON_ID=311494 /ORGANISM="Alexandrium monilatum, Strain CCMP3105" /LENGTH=294 /DNA_ID=CAMNT_0016482553 /DNA_START=1 /DNA_END=885 /DNA_ORIENTATION=+
MRQMNSPMDGMIPMGGGGSQVMMMSSSGGGSGAFSSNTMVMSSTIGADGQVHTEHYSSSAVGDHGRRISEVQQAYRNSTTGVDKMSLERQMLDQGRKMVKERNRHSGEERTTDLFRGIEAEEADDFERRWQGEAKPHLPSHCLPAQQLMMTGGNAAGASSRRSQVAGPYAAGPAALTAAPANTCYTVPAAPQGQYTAPGPRTQSSYMVPSAQVSLGAVPAAPQGQYAAPGPRTQTAYMTPSAQGAHAPAVVQDGAQPTAYIPGRTTYVQQPSSAPVAAGARPATVPGYTYTVRQ